MDTLRWISLGWVCTVAAKSAYDTSKAIQSGVVCEVNLSALLPSQLYIGLDEVSEKVNQLAWYDTSEKPCYGSAQEALNDAGITVVQGLACNQFYITDGHHTVNAAWKYVDDASYSVKVEVVDSYCQQVMTAESFWTEMINSSYAFPYALNDESDLSTLSAREMSELVPNSVLAMTDWWYRSLAYLVKVLGDFHPLKDNQGHSVPFGKFFEGQCLKDLGVEPQNMTRSVVGYAATLFDDTDSFVLKCQLDAPPVRRSLSDIFERDISC